MHLGFTSQLCNLLHLEENFLGDTDQLCDNLVGSIAVSFTVLDLGTNLSPCTICFDYCNVL